MRQWMFVGLAMAAGCSFVAVAGDAFAQDASTRNASTRDASTLALTPSQQLGRRLFGQDCGVCHTPPTITSGLYGPALSADVVKGNETAIADFIGHGDDRMPGFQYYYTPAQIRAIVDYLDTVPKPAPIQAPSGRDAATAGGE
jgi:mono/diheme cytochrome c family protein